MHKNELLTVGVFGYYKDFNFGDDLMAYLTCQYLKTIDHIQVILWGRNDFGTKYGFRVESSLEKFVDKVDMVVFGGGGVLLPRKLAWGDIYSQDIDGLCELCRKKKIAIYNISIGGVGASLSKVTSLAARRLVSESEFTTVRNPQDMKALHSVSVSGKYYHDIIWTTPRYFPTEKAPRRNYSIGINVQKHGNILKRIKGKFFDVIMKFIIKKNKNYNFVFIDLNSNPTRKFTDIDLSSFSDNCKSRKFSDLAEDIRFIQSLDLLITDRLHIGLTALSYKIPTISFSANKKAKIAYKNCNLARFCWGLEGFLKLFYYFSTPKRFKDLLDSFTNIKVDPIAENAMNHFTELSRIIEKEKAKFLSHSLV